MYIPPESVQKRRRLENNQVARKTEPHSFRKVRQTWYFCQHLGFIFQKDKLPVYDIPNIDGFELKPYVEFLAPKLKSELLIHQQTVNKKKIQEFKEAK